MKLRLLFAALAGTALAGSIQASEPSKRAMEQPVRTVADAVKALERQPAAGPKLKLLNLGEVIRAQDYPEQAIEKEEQGTAQIRLTVDGAGKVTNCAVEKSSGSAILDDTSCRLYRERARYEPLPTATGSRTSVERVSWKMFAEGGGRSRLGWFQRTKMVIKGDGSVLSCTQESSERSDVICTMPDAFPKEIAAKYVKAVGDPAKLILETRFSPEDEAVEPPHARTAFPMRSAKLVVKSDGTLRSCELLDAGSSPRDSVCREVAQYPFEKIADAPDATGIVRIWAYLEPGAN